MIHGRDRFQDILGAKESIKGFMQRGYDACLWGYFDVSFLGRVVDRRNGASKWGYIFSVGRGGVAEEEGYPYLLGWHNFS